MTLVLIPFLEAIACGLTPLGLKSGGHPELINDKRFLFRSKKRFI